MFSEIEQRIAHERRPSTAALEVEVTEIGPGPGRHEVLALGELRVEAFEVDHRPVRHAFGFLFRTPEARLVLSGDTRACAAVVEAARGADLLVHEVFVHREMPLVAGVRSAETVANVASYHTLSSEVGKVAAEAGVGCPGADPFRTARLRPQGAPGRGRGGLRRSGRARRGLDDPRARDRPHRPRRRGAQPRPARGALSRARRGP